MIHSVTKYSLIWEHGYADQKEGSGPNGSGYERSTLVHLFHTRRSPGGSLELPLSCAFTSPLLSTRHLSGSLCDSVQDFSATQYTLYTFIFLRGPVKHPLPECHIQKQCIFQFWHQCSGYQHSISFKIKLVACSRFFQAPSPQVMIQCMKDV